jgi:TonB family protein
MRPWLIAAALAVAGATSAEPAPNAAAPPGRHLITNPDWLHKPGPDDFSSLFPSGATSTGVVVIQCEVTSDGHATGCVVLAENPAGQGFGAAALKIAPRFQMKPETLDGKPVGGGVFQVQIHFGYPGLFPLKWEHQPSDAELAAVWPEKGRGVTASVTLKCRIDIKGFPNHCRVDRETPPALGFGAAALKLEPVLRLSRPEHSIDEATLTVAFVPPRPKQTGLPDFGFSASGLTNAPWKATPSAADLAAAWPKAASADLESGRVRLRCGFDKDGGLEQCTVLSEDPARQGFSEAALALAARFRVRITDGAGEQLAKAKIVLPVTFTNPKKGSQSPAQITEFNWTRYIDQDRMTDLYPAKADDAGVKTGRGVVDCRVAADGAVVDCAVSGEDPAGMGFGQAALEAVKYFAVNPWTDDGRPVEGARIRIPFRFNDAGPPAPAAAGAQDKPAVPSTSKPGGG